MSLKANLNQIIKDRNGGIFTLNELEAWCHKVPCKLASAERKLRPSESPNIERIMKKNYILGYRYHDQVREKRVERIDPPDPRIKRQSVPDLRQSQLSGFPHLPQRLV